MSAQPQSPAQPQAPAPPAPARAIELLHAVPSAVAVSSTVRNNSDLPANLVDGDLTTTWSSRTGDLTTAWISFRVPSQSHVTAIKMTAGYTKETRTADLFTQNQRIRRVRVTRAGVVLGEFPLDPERRDLQTLAVDSPGGEFTVSFVDVMPGSRPDWREACVSELEVWGQPPAGAETAAHNAPGVSVGAMNAAGASVGAINAPDASAGATNAPGVSVGAIDAPAFDAVQAARRDARAAREARRLAEARLGGAETEPAPPSEVEQPDASDESDPNVRYLLAREREADAVVALAQAVCTQGQPVGDVVERYRRLQAEITGYRTRYAQRVHGEEAGEEPSPRLVRAALLNRQTAIDAITSRSRCGADQDVAFRPGHEAEILAPEE